MDPRIPGKPQFPTEQEYEAAMDAIVLQVKRSRIGMPTTLLLQEFGAMVWDAFGHPPYHVGSSLMSRETGKLWNDVDIRLILPDEEYENLGYGDPARPHCNAKWRAVVKVWSYYGKMLTGLPIDFQIQQQTVANKEFDGPRSAIGIPVKIANGQVQNA